MPYKYHRSQLTAAERVRARDDANGVNLAARYVSAGGTLAATPTEADERAAAKWRDAPLAGHQTHTFKSGPDLEQLLSAAPEQPAPTASSPLDIRVGGRD
jgi:hypothetical protein